MGMNKQATCLLSLCDLLRVVRLSVVGSNRNALPFVSLGVGVLVFCCFVGFLVHIVGFVGTWPLWLNHTTYLIVSRSGGCRVVSASPVLPQVLLRLKG